MLAALAVALAFGYACSWLMDYLGLAIRDADAIQAAIYLVFFAPLAVRAYRRSG